MKDNYKAVERKYRLDFWIGVGAANLLVAVSATGFGFFIADYLNKDMMIGLAIVNPVYFICVMVVAMKNIQMINVVIQNTVTKKNIFSATLCHQLFSNVWKKNAQITIRITNHKESKKLNGQYRNIHSATNVLSFLIDNQPNPH